MISTTESVLSSEEREVISAIFTPRYYELACFNGVIYVSYLILRLFEKIGILGAIKKTRLSLDEIIAEFNFTSKAKYALEWMLEFLAQNGFLQKLEERGNKRYYFKEVASIDLEAFLQENLERDRKFIPSVKLMDYVISEYPNFFNGAKKGFEILFAPDKAILWNDYFSNDNSGYRVYNFLGAFGILKWALKKEGIRFLEVGGGTGNASSALIDKLKEKGLLNKINEYIFSDISPIFLRIGNREIMNKAGDGFRYSLKKLDFDKSLVSQGIKEKEIDIVYGVNTLHVAKNLLSALRNIYEVISPGGMLIVSEYCRPDTNYLLLQEFIFCLLDNYVEVDLDKNLRPTPGFLDYAHWRANLEAAGFTNIEAVFNTDGNYPQELKTKIGILAAAIKAEKSG